MGLNKEMIVSFIRAYEYHHGENFFDQNEIYINPLTLMTWCFGKGYLSKEQYDEWSSYYGSKDIVKRLYATDEMNYLYNHQYPHLSFGFAVVTSKEYNEEDYFRALCIFAEFIMAMQVYTERMIDVIKNNEVEINEFLIQ